MKDCSQVILENWNPSNQNPFTSSDDTFDDEYSDDLEEDFYNYEKPRKKVYRIYEDDTHPLNIACSLQTEWDQRLIAERKAMEVSK